MSESKPSLMTRGFQDDYVVQVNQSQMVTWPLELFEELAIYAFMCDDLSPQDKRKWKQGRFASLFGRRDHVSSK